MSRLLAFLVLAGALSFALPAKAQLYTQTAGPALQYDISTVNGHWTGASLSNGAGAGVSYALNFVQTKDGQYRLLSVWFEALLSGQTSGNASQFNWLAAAGIGTLNNLISFGVGIPFISARSTNPLTGIFVGKVNASDLHFLVGFHLTIELSPVLVAQSAARFGAPSCSGMPGHLCF